MTHTWQDKAHREIAKACTIAYNEANTSKSGKPYKKHHPYTTPIWVDDLVKALGANDEETAKAIFVHEHLRDF